MRVRRDERDPAYTVAHSACVAARELQPRRARRPDAVRPVGAARQRAPSRRADPRALARPRDRAPLRAHVGRQGRVDAPPRGHRGAHRRRRLAASSSSAGASAGQRVGITAGLPSGRARDDEPAPDPGALSGSQVTPSAATGRWKPRVIGASAARRVPGVEDGLLASELGAGRARPRSTCACSRCCAWPTSCSSTGTWCAWEADGPRHGRCAPPARRCATPPRGEARSSARHARPRGQENIARTAATNSSASANTRSASSCVAPPRR